LTGPVWPHRIRTPFGEASPRGWAEAGRELTSRKFLSYDWKVRQTGASPAEEADHLSCVVHPATSEPRSYGKMMLDSVRLH
jgi:hypothetical protein